MIFLYIFMSICTIYTVIDLSIAVWVVLADKYGWVREEGEVEVKEMTITEEKGRRK